MARRDKLGEAPKEYDKADQDRLRRLIEHGLSQPPAAGTIQVTQVVKEIIQVIRVVKTKTEVAVGIANTVTGAIDIAVPSGILVKLAVSKASWLRFYATAADRSSDSTRLRTVDPVAGLGVLGEFIVTATLAGVAFRVAPVMFLYNNDAPVAHTIYYALTNDSGVQQDITMTLTLVDLET